MEPIDLIVLVSLATGIASCIWAFIQVGANEKKFQKTLDVLKEEIKKEKHD